MPGPAVGEAFRSSPSAPADDDVAVEIMLCHLVWCTSMVDKGAGVHDRQVQKAHALGLDPSSPGVMANRVTRRDASAMGFGELGALGDGAFVGGESRL
jgi:hypothetical protein